MNDHPCTRAFDHQGRTAVPWIIGASIASVTTVSLATFFWSRQAGFWPVSYTHLRAHETVLDLVCRLLL